MTTQSIRQITGVTMAAGLGLALLSGCAQEPAQLTSGTAAQACTEDTSADTVTVEMLEEGVPVGTAEIPVLHNDCD
ncbi:hypothetical protein [Micrococcus terreus]|uniref:Uncharacterized protein n=1 Tax=Micrococcus terreus TaxID=574650 RepID=A0A1I7MKB8_9MICC|nr:hypothetical protein [Micrococcus terreus]SFV22350.1 hypothetical protein SAMN04487966_10460 [Micrococcus terreus]